MNFENIAKDMGKAIDKVPEIYDDGLKRLSQSPVK